MNKPQLALHMYVELDKKRTAVHENRYIITEKYDGWYGYIDVNDTYDNRIMSRAGRVIPSLLNLSRTLMARCKELNIKEGRLIFEILVDGLSLFSDLNGVLNRSKGNCQADGAYLRVHSYIPKGGESFSSEARYLASQLIVGRLNLRPVMPVPVLGKGNVSDMQDMAEQVWALGGEGVIGVNINAPYEYGKRNANILKVKCEVTLDLFVTGTYEGEGKYTGMVGGLIVQNRAGVTFNVSGMTDAQRQMWTDYPNMIIGSVVEIQAMKILHNGSLREGRFKTVRHDKVFADCD